MNIESVPLKYVKTLIRIANAQGYDVEPIASAIGLKPDYLKANINQSQAVPAEIYNRIYTHVMDQLQDESFGLNFKQKMPAGSFRIMCRSLIHSINLGEAMERAGDFYSFCRSLSGPNVPLNINIKSNQNGKIIFDFPDTLDFLVDKRTDPFYGITNCISVWRRFCSWLIGRQFYLDEVHLQLPAPTDKRYLKKLFNCPIKFGTLNNSILFDRKYLTASLVHDEDSLRKFLKSAPYQLLVTNELESDGGILSQMRRIIGHDMSREFPSVINMAFALNISVRTLRRRLKEVDTTYQKFKDKLRCNSAKQLLAKPELKINAIAALLGFDEPSAFHRSFKKWTKQTPGEYRDSLL